MVGSVPPADTESVALEGGDSLGVRATETMVRSLEPVISVTFRVGTSADERNLLVVYRYSAEALIRERRKQSA